MVAVAPDFELVLRALDKLMQREALQARQAKDHRELDDA